MLSSTYIYQMSYLFYLHFSNLSYEASKFYSKPFSSRGWVLWTTTLFEHSFLIWLYTSPWCCSNGMATTLLRVGPWISSPPHMRLWVSVSSYLWLDYSRHDTTLHINVEFFSALSFGRAIQWYDTHTVGSINSTWELHNKFCFKFPNWPSHRPPNRKLSTDQEESIGTGWPRFSMLTNLVPKLSIPDYVLLIHVWLGFSMESAL